MHTGIHGEILKIEHLSFAYEKNEQVLTDINFMAKECSFDIVS